MFDATTEAKRLIAHLPLYDVHPKTGATIEVFYAERVFDGMEGAGWFWWTCTDGLPPEWPPKGPFGSSYRAWCDAVGEQGQQ
jgi:hypothetical protein